MKLGPIFVRLDPGLGVITEFTPFFEDVASAAICEAFRERYTPQPEAPEPTCSKIDLYSLCKRTPKEDV
jgi:hypothetical protein